MKIVGNISLPTQLYVIKTNQKNINSLYYYMFVQCGIIYII